MIRRVMTRLLIGIVPCLAGLLFLGALPAGAAGGDVPTAARQFSACVLSHQGGNHHKATIAEATACAPSARVIDESQLGQVGSATLATPAIVKRHDGSATLIGWLASPILAANVISGCYNTWTQQDPWNTNALEYVAIDVRGYGNHCGYSNVPSTPSVNARCFVPWCSATHDAGRYDSNQGAAWFNDRRAAGWANIYFNIGDTWFCRGYVDTNGIGSSFCS